ncbi:Nucleotidyl transferase [Desulfonema limicola]|uniref:Nucleotidyl transferase n=1 Tax=Desulfonema limicola TaxID=45656 RepID=A0A975GFG5_9BACT|nr:nucleotidyltransferase domain-containing protein [Desulfonema limicola]QTA79213.1 Nucleotidyl transferase [Desulfonema limicola]
MIKQIPITHNVSELLPDAALYFQKRKDVLFAYLFGSMASGTCNMLSDIDIAVYLKKRKLSEKRLEIMGDLADIFKTDEIDLVILNTAPLSLQMRILKQRKVLADNNPFFRHKYESYTMRAYFDFSKLEHRILERRFLNG